MNTCCVIIPIYNLKPAHDEILSIKRTCEVLSGDYDIYYVCSEKLDTSEYLKIADLKAVTFDSRFFKSNKSYSRLLLSVKFYNAFMSYEYMLIAQTDTYIVNTGYKLSDFIDMGYDYIGAYWINGPFFKPYSIKDRFKLPFVRKPSEIHVGNGGFSLRNIAVTRDVVKRKRYHIAFLWRFNEDLFFSNEAYKYVRRAADSKAGSGGIKYIAAPDDVAKRFALESNMREEIEAGNAPYAVHAFGKYYPELPERIIKDYKGNSLNL